MHTFNIFIFFKQYGRIFLQSVPFGRFDYVENTSMLKHDIIINYDKNSNFCYTLFVNIDFPESVQKVHEDLLITKQRAELRNDFEKKSNKW